MRSRYAAIAALCMALVGAMSREAPARRVPRDEPPVEGASPASASFRSYQAHIAAAEKSLRLDDARELRRWLETAPPEHRGWEWRYLHEVQDRSSRTVSLPVVPRRVASFAGGRMLAVVAGEEVRLLSYPSLETLGTLAGHGDAVYRAEPSPDGSKIVTVSRDATSRVWDVASRSEISSIDLANPAVAAVAFDPKGLEVATCAWERDEGKVHGVVWIWDAKTGEVRVRRRVGVKPLSSISYTPDGTTIVVGSWDGCIHLLDSDANERDRIVLPDEGVYNAINDIAVDPSGRWIAAGTKDRTIRVLGVESGELVATLRGHTESVETVAFTDDGGLLASGSGDTTVRWWRTADWSAAGTLRGHRSTVSGAAWERGSSEIVTASRDGTIRVWDRATAGAEQLDIDVGTRGTYSALLSPDGRRIAVACFDGSLRLFDSETGEMVANWSAHPGSTCNSVDFSADGSRLVSCSWEERVRVWDPQSGEMLAVLELETGAYSCAVSPDGSRVALSTSSVEVWDIDEARLIHRLEEPSASPRRLAFSPNGANLIVGWSHGVAIVYDATTGVTVGRLEGHEGRVEAVAFTSDSQRVVTGDGGGVVRVFPIRGGASIHATDTGDRAVNHVAVRGDRIAAATDRLWILDLSRGGRLLERFPHDDTVWHVSWSRDGSRVATCSTDGTVATMTARSLDSRVRSRESDAGR